MDGSNRFELVKTRLGSPTGITLDLVTKRVYWTDSHFNLVETVTYSGLDRYYNPQIAILNLLGPYKSVVLNRGARAH